MSISTATILGKIAKDQMRIETLQTRHSDALDFHTVSVWSAKSALEASCEAGRASATLEDVIRDNLSPEAVASITAWLQPARTNDEEVDRQVRWFVEQLVQVLGGPEQQNNLMKELGL